MNINLPSSPLIAFKVPPCFNVTVAFWWWIMLCLSKHKIRNGERSSAPSGDDSTSREGRKVSSAVMTTADMPSAMPSRYLYLPPSRGWQCLASNFPLRQVNDSIPGAKLPDSVYFFNTCSSALPLSMRSIQAFLNAAIQCYQNMALLSTKRTSSYVQSELMWHQ